MATTNKGSALGRSLRDYFMTGVRFPFLVILCASLAIGCASGSGGDSPKSARAEGLTPSTADTPGRLLIREHHQIGSYDAFLIPEASISYGRQSRRLPPGMEMEFLAALEQSLIDAAGDAEIPIVNEPGACVLQVGMGLAEVYVDRKPSRTLGTMTLVMEFRDTMSGEPLLRYATARKIEDDRDGTPRGERFRLAFDEMVTDMELGDTLRVAGLSGDDPRPGCRGKLAEWGTGASPPAARAR